MIVQLTHMRPKPGNFDKVIALFEEWGEAEKHRTSRPAYSFLSQDEDHLFLVSIHHDQREYEAAARANAEWVAKLMPLLVDTQGPTYYGTVLRYEGSIGGDGPHLPSAIKIGNRHG
ncbi:MAG: hypothetical protein FJ318_01130 [SAR202 cluster bacterium]|nr:hypothetical protein [SAR202 cluster bacterium]